MSSTSSTAPGAQQETPWEDPQRDSDDGVSGGPGADRGIAVAVVLIAVALLLVTLTFPASLQAEDPGTAALPRLIGGALLILGVALFLRPESATVAPPVGTRGRLAAVVIATILLVFLVVPLGFPITMALFLAFTLWLMGVHKPLGLVLYPVIAAAFLYYLFAELLDVYLPAGILEGLI